MSFFFFLLHVYVVRVVVTCFFSVLVVRWSPVYDRSVASTGRDQPLASHDMAWDVSSWLGSDDPFITPSSSQHSQLPPHSLISLTLTHPLLLSTNPLLR